MDSCTLLPDPYNNRPPSKKSQTRASAASKDGARPKAAKVGKGASYNVRPPTDESLLQGESAKDFSSGASVITEDPLENSSVDENRLHSVVRPNGTFRLKNKMVHLTYSYHFDEKEYIDFFTGYLGKRGIVIQYYSVVKEFGKRKQETGEPYAHTHVALAFGAPIIVTNPKFFDYRENPDITEAQQHCHIKAIHKSNWDYICTVYHRKDGEPYTNYTIKIPTVIPSIEAVENCATAKEVVYLAYETGNFLKAGPLLKAWEHIKKAPPVPQTILPEEFYPWQQEVINEAIIGLWDDRIITWYVDTVGDSGKTLMAKLLSENYKGIVLTSADEASSIYAVKQYIDMNNEDPQYIIYNLSRQTTEAQLVYICNVLEKFKDSVFTSTKYESKSIRIKKSPQIIVFANNAPPESGILTLDRWDIRVLDTQGLDVSHRFHGYSAAGRHEILLEEEIFRNKEDNQFKVTKDINPQTIFDIGFFNKGYELIEKANRMFYLGKIAEIRMSKIPITENMVNYGVGEEGGRPLTIEELKAGVIYKGSLEVRDMTPEQKKAMLSLVGDTTKKKEKFIKRIKTLNSDNLLSQKSG